MGLTFIDLVIRSSKGATEARTVRCLVDSGATYTIVPASVLMELGIDAEETITFELADGSTVDRRIGWVYVEFDGRSGYSPVAFGEPGDSQLLGVLTLENLRLWLDPLQRELHPLKQTLKPIRDTRR
jgi:predicted aspartyl protease